MSTPLTNPLVFLFGSRISGVKKIDSDIIKIRGRTILLQDKTIQTRDITSIEAVPLAGSFPWVAPMLVSLAMSDIGLKIINPFISLLLLLLGGFMIYKYFEKKNIYGLLFSISSRSGGSILVSGRSFEFIKLAALALNNTIQTNEGESLDIHLGQEKISPVDADQTHHSAVNQLPSVTKCVKEETDANGIHHSTVTQKITEINIEIDQISYSVVSLGDVSGYINNSVE